MSRFLARAQVRMFLRVLEIGLEDRRRNPELEIRVLGRERLHGLDGLQRLVEAALHIADLIVDVADAVERDTDADRQVVCRAELHDARQHRDGTVRRETGRVDPDLAEAGQPLVKEFDHVGQVVSGGRLTAGDVQVLEGTPELVVHDAVELLERHVALAIASLPVVAHLAARIADEGAVIDQHRRADGLDLRHDERVREIARHARGGAGQIVQAEGVDGHNGARPKSRVLRRPLLRFRQYTTRGGRGRAAP